MILKCCIASLQGGNKCGIWFFSLVYCLFEPWSVFCEIFKWVFFFYKSDLNETFNQSLIDLYLINHLTIYRANKAHQKEAIYGLFKEFNFFINLNKYGLYSTLIAL